MLLACGCSTTPTKCRTTAAHTRSVLNFARAGLADGPGRRRRRRGRCSEESCMAVGRRTERHSRLEGESLARPGVSADTGLGATGEGEACPRYGGRAAAATCGDWTPAGGSSPPPPPTQPPTGRGAEDGTNFAAAEGGTGGDGGEGGGWAGIGRCLSV